MGQGNSTTEPECTQNIRNKPEVQRLQHAPYLQGDDVKNVIGGIVHRYCLLAVKDDTSLSEWEAFYTDVHDKLEGLVTYTQARICLQCVLAVGGCEESMVKEIWNLLDKERTIKKQRVRLHQHQYLSRNPAAWSEHHARSENHWNGDENGRYAINPETGFVDRLHDSAPQENNKRQRREVHHVSSQAMMFTPVLPLS